MVCVIKITQSLMVRIAETIQFKIKETKSSYLLLCFQNRIMESVILIISRIYSSSLKLGSFSIKPKLIVMIWLLVSVVKEYISIESPYKLETR